MHDKTACGVFLTRDLSGWHAACYVHEPVWYGPTRDTVPKANLDADRHERLEHPNE